MTRGLVQPVDAGHLARDHHLRPVRAERRSRGRQHGGRVVEQRFKVKPQKEFAIVARIVAVRIVGKEARLARLAVVRAGIVGSAIPPLGVPDRGSVGGQRGQHVLIIHLEFANAGKRPARERVGRVAQLAGRALANLHLRHDVGRVREHVGGEGLDEIRIHLNRRAPADERHMVGAQRDVPENNGVMEDWKLMMCVLSFFKRPK